MREPKNWLVGVILVAIIGFMVNQVGGCLFSSNEMTVKLDPETIKLLKENQKSELKIVIEGKETTVSKPNSDGEVKIKVSEDNDGKKAELKVVDKEGKALKKKEVTLKKPVEKKPDKAVKSFADREVITDNFKFDFTDIKRNGNEVKMFYKVTNLHEADRQLAMTCWASIFYTDVGTQHGSNVCCIADRCNTHIAKNSMPPDIYLNGNITIPNVAQNATMIKRGIFEYNGKRFEQKNIKLPAAK